MREVLGRDVTELPVDDMLREGLAVLTSEQLTELLFEPDALRTFDELILEALEDNEQIAQTWLQGWDIDDMENEARGMRRPRWTFRFCEQVLEELTDLPYPRTLSREVLNRLSFPGGVVGEPARETEPVFQNRERASGWGVSYVPCEFGANGEAILFELPGNKFAIPLSPDATTLQVVPTPAKYAGDDDYAYEGEDGIL